MELFMSRICFLTPLRQLPPTTEAQFQAPYPRRSRILLAMTEGSSNYDYLFKVRPPSIDVLPLTEL